MKKFWVQCTNISVFVFVMLWCANAVTDLKFFSAFDPITQALTDFELTDIVFAELRLNPKVDTNIVVVNLAPTRRQIAQQVQIISSLNPKVIGIDSFFNCEGNLYDTINCPQLLDTLGNLLLGSAIEDAGNVVLVSKLLQKVNTTKNLNAIDVYDSIEYSDPIIRKGAKLNAYASLVTNADYQEDVKLCRSFIPTQKINLKKEYAFAVAMAMMFDSVKAKKFLDRNKEEEIINYRGNVEIQNVKLKTLRDKDLGTTNFSAMFYAVDWDELLTGQVAPDLFKDRIVIMGAMGDYFGDPAWTDKYFTPLNKKVAGRANPDMFGVVVHANIVAMILNGDFIDELTKWQKYLIAFFVCFTTVALFIYIDKKIPIWFDALSVLIQISQILALSFLMVKVFEHFSYKLDLSITIGVSALVGPSYDIFKSAQNEIENWLTKRKETV